MKNRKKNCVLRILSCMLFALLMTTSVYADSKTILDTVADDGESTETDDDYAEDTSYSLLRGSDLKYGTSAVKKVSSTKVNVSGRTQCSHVCDTVYVYLYLERKVNGTYSTYKSWKFSTSDATNIEKSINVIVPSGYYYRVRGYHATDNDGSTESTTTLTNGVLVS